MPVATKFGALDIRILRFYTHYELSEGGEPKATDMVSFCPPGMADKAVKNERVEKILRATPAQEIAYAKKQIVEPAYEAWKRGQEIPDNGTPLAAWAGVSPEQVEALKSIGLLTIESVADLTDGEITKKPMPGLRTLREMARRFVTTLDKGEVTNALKEKDNEIAALRAQMEELADLVRVQGVQGVQGVEEEDEVVTKRGPGRPRKAA